MANIGGTLLKKKAIFLLLAIITKKLVGSSFSDVLVGIQCIYYYCLPLYHCNLLEKVCNSP